jgi:hypothetical protein
MAANLVLFDKPQLILVRFRNDRSHFFKSGK